MTKTSVRFAALFVILEAVDCFSTMWAVNHGFREFNVLMAPFINTWLLPVVKIGPAIVAILIMLPLAKYKPKLVEIGLVTVSVWMVGILISNLIAVIG